MDSIRDMSRGHWRNFYAGELTDKRLTALSIGAELTINRLKLLADDFGNLQGELDLMQIQAYPRRPKVTRRQFRGWIGELDGAAFVGFYEAGEDRYGHIHGWTLTQPPPRNGKRVRRFPASPFEDESTADESGCTDDGDSECVQMLQIHPRRNQTRPNPAQETETDPAQPKAPASRPNGSGGILSHDMGAGGSGY